MGGGGGGVAAYVRNEFSVSKLSMTSDCADYETLWLKLDWNSKIIICTVVYNPPKPIYNVSIFKDFLFNSVYDLVATEPNCIVLLAGNFNQLEDNDVCMSGLVSLVRAPTRGPNFLDRIYSSAQIDCNVKVVKSAVKSDHSAIGLSDPTNIVTNFIKVKKQVQYRSQSPAQNTLFLSHVN